jgi:hypothetical protein
VFLKKSFLQKSFEQICENPYDARILKNGFKKRGKEKPTLRWKKFSQNTFSKTPFLKRKPCMNCNTGISLIGEYHSEEIFGLTFLREEKEYEHGKADKFPLTQLFPTASIALHHGLFTARAYSGCIHGINHQHGIHKHDIITIIMIYIQLCEVLWKQNAGTKE